MPELASALSRPHRTQPGTACLRSGLVGAMLLAATALAPGEALAQHHEQGRRGHEHGASAWQRGPMVLDHRHRHDHYYPAHGHAIGVLPVGAVSVRHGGASWFFHGGVWFRPLGGRFVVGVPPLGIVVPMLPPAYASLWIGGQPYYYANSLYYAPAPGGYVVVNPPSGMETAQPLPLAPPPKPTPEAIVYPRNEQSAERQELDLRECNRWATTQRNAMNDASVFQRAVAACMDARGYTVR